MAYLVFSPLVLIPFLILVSFIISLVLYCTAKIKYKKNPGMYNEMQLKTRRNMLIATSVATAIVLVVVVGFFVMLMTAVAYM